MDPLFHTPTGDVLYMRRLVNYSSLWNFTLDNWFHNETTDGFLPLGIKVTIVVVYSIVCIVGLVGNCSVMYVIIRFTKMKTATNIYIFNLALADTLCLITLPFQGTDTFMGSWPFGNALCKIAISIDYYNMFTSTFTLTMMSVDRYIAICHPIKALDIRTPHKAKVVNICIWALASVFGIPVMVMGSTEYENGEKQPRVQNMGPPQPKRSRKSFPRWNPGNGVRKYHNDRAFKSTVEDMEAGVQPSPATASGLRGGRTLSIMMRPHSSELMTHSSSPVHASPPYLTISTSGGSPRATTQSSPASRECITTATGRKSNDLLAQCQKHICINSCDESKGTNSLETDDFEVVQQVFGSCGTEREEKLEQLERMVLGLQQEVFSLKQKVQHLEAASCKEQEPPCQTSRVSELFNGYTREQLKEAIHFDQKISTACKTLLYKLFTSDYIQSHSITGRRGNTFREAKPMMDERCIKIIRVLLKQKFGEHLSDTVITEKIQNVQKALRQKFKTECL
ncbi:nociceptin receptor isoform X3 [Hemicordylus capensis]|uniref:nociceptin receptor isoform X3 n=1 Tax=Hemicordylus capensis TaxID=884348 RepID=UPI002303E423|nr:nociceptin receptor isoform X3 [Hemicordylus capensis]